MNIIICWIREFCVFFLDQDWKLVILERAHSFLLLPAAVEMAHRCHKILFPTSNFPSFSSLKIPWDGFTNGQAWSMISHCVNGQKNGGTGQEEEETTKVSEWGSFTYSSVMDGSELLGILVILLTIGTSFVTFMFLG